MCGFEAGLTIKYSFGELTEMAHLEKKNLSYYYYSLTIMRNLSENMKNIKYFFQQLIFHLLREIQRNLILKSGGLECIVFTGPRVLCVDIY